ncbi:MAG: nitroreductase family protein [Clostridia bacterium]|nr:nitroreductase family protein [Clostridia bacterium]
MDVLEAIRTRRSIRRFDRSAPPVTPAELRTILEAGFAAPSAHNLQPRQYYVVRDRAKLTTIADIGRYTKMAAEADLCILVAGETDVQKTYDLLVMDCSAAVENMLLAAHGLGLGAVWCGVFPGASLDVGTLKRMLDMPPNHAPLGMVMVGRPGEVRAPVDRFNPASVHGEDA